MASITLNRAGAEAGRLPAVCICCGRPATDRVQHKFYLRSMGIVVGMMFVGWPWRRLFIPESYEYSQFPTPVCGLHRWTMSLHAYILTAGSLVALVLAGAFIASNYNPDLEWLGFYIVVPLLLMIPIMVITAVVSWLRTPRMVGHSTARIELVAVSETFAAACRPSVPQALPGMPWGAAQVGPKFNWKILAIAGGVAAGGLLLMVLGGVVIAMFNRASDRSTFARMEADSKARIEEMRANDERRMRSMSQGVPLWNSSFRPPLPPTKTNSAPPGPPGPPGPPPPPASSTGSSAPAGLIADSPDPSATDPTATFPPAATTDTLNPPAETTPAETPPPSARPPGFAPGYEIASAEDLQVGDRVLVVSESNWRPAKVTAVQSSQVDVELLGAEGTTTTLALDLVRHTMPEQARNMRSRFGSQPTNPAGRTEIPPRPEFPSRPAGGSAAQDLPGFEATAMSQIAAKDHVHVLWGRKWFPAQVINERGKQVLIRYDGYSDAFNEWVTLDRLRLVKEPKSKTPAVAATDPFAAPAADPFAAAVVRTWTDASGQFKIEAELTGVTDGKAQLKKPDGSILAIPLDKLSAADQAIIKEKFP